MKTVRFVSLAAVLAVTLWISVHPAAIAYPTNPCYMVDGTSCAFEGVHAQRLCWDTTCQNYRTCTCSSPPLAGHPDPSWICEPPSCIVEAKL
jgi:hypothetical protein